MLRFLGPKTVALLLLLLLRQLSVQVRVWDHTVCNTRKSGAVLMVYREVI